jgi:hypothetical protein
MHAESITNSFESMKLQISKLIESHDYHFLHKHKNVMRPHFKINFQKFHNLTRVLLQDLIQILQSIIVYEFLKCKNLRSIETVKTLFTHLHKSKYMYEKLEIRKRKVFIIYICDVRILRLFTFLLFHCQCQCITFTCSTSFGICMKKVN